MTRCKSWIAVTAILIAAMTLLTVAVPQQAGAGSLRARLHQARHTLRDARLRLKTAEAELAAALASATSTPTPTPSATASGEASSQASLASGEGLTETPSPTPSPTATAAPSVEDLRARVAKATKAVHRWARVVRRLARRYRLQMRLARWERRGDWMPIIRISAARYHVKADGVYRIMMRESHGQRFAGAGSSFRGLFQYHTGTWSANWNPWRRDSIYDGSSQINATCYAIHRGYGPRMWTSTFASQY